MLINLTNHPSSLWSEKQLEAARTKYGNIKDIPFPAIDPFMDKADLFLIAASCADQIIQVYQDIPFSEKHNFAVHIQGEQTFVYHVVSRLRAQNFTCLASTSQRVKQDLGNGRSQQQFEFVRFREY